MTEKQIITKQNKHIGNYNKALASCNKSAWGLAKVVFETVKSEDFAEVFGTMKDYASALNVSKGSLSKLVKAYERKMLITKEDADNYTVSQIEEFSTISMDETMNFVEEMEVSAKDTCATIRAKVKDWLAEDTDNAESAEEAEDTEETEETENTDDTLIIMYKGVEYQIENEEVKKQILAILQFDE